MRRRMMLGLKSELPSGYKRCEYLESTGTQYIDTGICGGTYASYEIKFDATDSVYKSFEQYFAGDNQSINIAKIYNSPQAGVIAACTKNYTLFVPSSGVHTVKIENKQLFVDKKEISGYTDSSDKGWGILTFYVFGSHSEPQLTSSMRLYALKMWTNGLTERDFIPALDPSGRPCMYDTVTKQPFYNQGTGEFLYELSGGIK